MARTTSWGLRDRCYRHNSGLWAAANHYPACCREWVSSASSIPNHDIARSAEGCGVEGRLDCPCGEWLPHAFRGVTVLTLLEVWESRENARLKLSEAVQFFWTFRNEEYRQESQAPCRKLDDLETACEITNYTCVQSRPYYPEGLNCARLGQEFLLSIRVSINFTGLFDLDLNRPFGSLPTSIHNAARVYVGLEGEA